MVSPSRFKPTAMDLSRIKALLYGENGGGKTFLACTAPGKKVFVNYQGNLETLKRFPRTEWEAIDGPDDWPGIHSMFTDSYFDQFDTIVLDNATGLNRTLIQTALKIPMQTKGGDEVRVSPEMPSLRDYSLAAERLRVVLSQLAERADKQHVICICHVLTKEDKEGNITFAGPSVPGQVPAHVLSLFSEQLYLKMGSDGVPTTYFAPLGLYPATSRLKPDRKKAVRDLNLTALYIPLLEGRPPKTDEEKRCAGLLEPKPIPQPIKKPALA